MEALVTYMDDGDEHGELTTIFRNTKLANDNPNDVMLYTTILNNMENTHTQIYNKIQGTPALMLKAMAYYGYDESGNPIEGKSQATMDGEAFAGVMSAVNNMKRDYTTKENMNDGELFSSSSMIDTLNNLVAASGTAGLDSETVEELKEKMEGSSVMIIATGSDAPMVLANKN